ncbi:pectate lyase [Pontibacter qinzhouensis]|uniref:Pectate lyase n=1 Tax=Pontibacter qinzhouensis TaxID=2603253 RepID=A0A5C8K7G8_9BACT|nr:pectate lyase [Pontibacter qinzhouensis]TXK45751.1 pectate lyase [Pontibacter qinzhouensis]
MNRTFFFLLLWAGLHLWTVSTGNATALNYQQGTAKTDAVAENMLLYQRESGGWPKAVNNKAVNYTVTLTSAQKNALKAGFTSKDATIDNNATSKEIWHLAKAYKETENSRYLTAAKKGLEYLLRAQYPNGGWPQFYPDTSHYRQQVTFNDHAMVNVLKVMRDVNRGNGAMAAFSEYKEQAGKAEERGIACILKTQQKRNGKLTAWAAQYDHKTLKPATARSYELPGIALSESVEIVRFLMGVENPTPEIIAAVTGAKAWFDEVKIKDYTRKRMDAPAEASGRDVVFVAEKGAEIWARFYDFDTNKPFFSGRDGVKKNSLAEIENERRIGYAWYGTWPAESFAKEYPEWLQKWRKK